MTRPHERFDFLEQGPLCLLTRTDAESLKNSTLQLKFQLSIKCIEEVWVPRNAKYNSFSAAPAY